MKWHCGILDAAQVPAHGPGTWLQASLSVDRRLELAVWLAMPGFSITYHAHNLGLAWHTVRKYQAQLPGYDALLGEVAANWLSITRDDAVMLCRKRPASGDVPVVCQLRMLDDLKAGRSLGEVARDYGVRREWLGRMRQRGLSLRRRTLPTGFELLGAGIKSTVN